MSDNHEDVGGGRGLVTITTDGMEALNTNGTKEIVPPDSPKKGDLYVLSTTVAADGEIEIRRTLVEPGERTDSFTPDNDTSITPVKESLPRLEGPSPRLPLPSPSPEENRCEDNQQREKIKRTEVQQPLGDVPFTTEEDAVKGEPQDRLEVMEGVERMKDHDSVPSEVIEDSEEFNEELKVEIQKMIDECAAAIQEEKQVETEKESGEEVKEIKGEHQEVLQVEEEEKENLVVEAKEVDTEQKS
ncbi:unnamed protein product, partial [Hydatigera taeniaeformis]|uniref:Titin-like n=1 Tax=Hydatigena taeniaeformis TaxID=6205 RepID=A0A0R3WTL1_HYDTA